MIIDKLFEIEEVRHAYSIEVGVVANVTSGGSSRWGSDEPPWTDIEITDIYNPKTCKPVSKNLYSYLEKNYGDWIEDVIIEDAYDNGL